jgi:hypothetical protein
MTIYVHFMDGSCRRLCNVEQVRDAGVGTVTAINAFGGDAQRLEHVARVVVQPDRDEDEEATR